MTTDRRHVRHGFAAVRPYVYGPLDLIDLVQHAFGAEEIEADKPYDERQAGIRDRYGNTWWISTFTGSGS